MFGPDMTFLGVPPCDLATRPRSPAPTSWSSARRSTAARRTGPAPGSARRRSGPTDYLAARRLPAAPRAAGRPAARPAGARRRRRRDAARRHRAVAGALTEAVGDGRRRPGRSRSSSAATTRSRWPTSPASRAGTSRRPGLGGALRRARRHRGHRVRLALRPRPADAPADRVRRGRGDRFLQIGLRGYWPGPGDAGLDGRAADAVVRDDRDRSPAAWTTAWTRRSRIAIDDCDGVFLSVDIDVADPGTHRAPAPRSPAG